MDAVHLHLVLTHLPIVGTFFVTATFLWAAFRKEPAIGRFALYASVAVSLTAIPVYLAGMAAEEKIEHLPWASENLIDSHETIAAFALGLSILIFLLAVIIIIIGRRSDNIRPSMIWGMFLVTLLQFAVLSYTGNRGGLIGHPEIRGSNTYKGFVEKNYKKPGQRQYHKEDD